MRILLLTDPNSPHTYKWATSLAKEGIQIGMYGIVDQVHYDYNEFPNITVQVFTVKKFINRRNIFEKAEYLKVLPSLKKFIQTFTPDILHAHYASSYGLLGRLTKFRPYLISTWGSDVMQFPKNGVIQKQILKMNLNGADGIFTTSKALLHATKCYTNKDITIIPFGVDTDSFQPFLKKNQTDVFTLGCIKSMEDVYGIDLMIKVFAKIKKASKLKVKLLLVGKGSKTQNLKELSLALGIENDVIFTGRVPHSETPKMYNQLNLFLAFSKRESFGVSILEASACGIPVVANNIVGYQEVMQENTNGIFVDCNNEEEVVKSILQLMENPERCKELANKSVQFVKQNYEWTACVSKMITAYKSHL